MPPPPPGCLGRRTSPQTPPRRYQVSPAFATPTAHAPNPPTPPHPDPPRHPQILVAAATRICHNLGVLMNAGSELLLYQAHIDIIAHMPNDATTAGRTALAAWSAKENPAWLTAVRSDPLLPAGLLPKGYLGRQAWRKRKAAIRRAAVLAQQLTGEVRESSEDA